MASIKSRIHGCIFGGAIGDALGAPVEFSSMEAIRGRYGEEGIQDVPEDGHYTDDTQMTLRVAMGLCDALEEAGPEGWPDEEEAAKAISWQLVKWAELDPPRAPGTSCIYGTSNLARGVHWRECGKPDSKGCGAVMRSAPYGILGKDAESSASLAADHALMTHLHPAAQASAAALAAGIYSLLDGEDHRETVEAMMRAAEIWDIRTAALISFAWTKAPSVLVDPDSVLREWRGWTGDEAIAAAVYCWCKNPGDFQGAVRMAANSPGDSDSLGAITGNLVGAELGIEVIPQAWLDRIENAELLARTGDDLFEGFNAIWSND
jgi:ADP-ribosylglycohydrolase